MTRLLSLLILPFILSACNTTTADARLSKWGAITTLGEGWLVDAPVLTTWNGETISAWLAPRDNGDTAAFHLRRGSDEPLVLSLLVRYPRHVRVFAASSDAAHLLWLDTPPTGEVETAQLYSAYVNLTTREVERGTLAVSDMPVQHYDTLAIDDGSLFLAWSGGFSTERDIYLQTIDPLGRPRTAERVIRDGSYPSLVQTADGKRWLYWLQGNAPFRATMTEQEGFITLGEPIAVTAPVRFRAGTVLRSFTVAVDETYAYLFWQVMTVGGDVETRFTSGSLGGVDYPPPQVLTLAISDDATFITGLNGGTANLVTAGSTSVQYVWPSSSSQVQDLLPLAIVMGDMLGVLYMDDGEPSAFQAVVSPVPLLFSHPTLLIDRERHVTLAWSAPGNTQHPTLYQTSTR